LPTPAPTPAPTLAPTPQHTLAPTPAPTLAPTPNPTPTFTPASTLTNICDTNFIACNTSNGTITINSSIENSQIITISYSIIKISFNYTQLINGTLVITIGNNKSGSLIIGGNGNIQGQVILNITSLPSNNLIELINAEFLVSNVSLQVITNLKCKKITAQPIQQGNNLYALLSVEPSCNNNNNTALIAGAVVGGIFFYYYNRSVSNCIILL